MRNTCSQVIRRAVPASRSTPSIVIRVPHPVAGDRLVVDRDDRLVQDSEVLTHVVAEGITVADDRAARAVPDVPLSDQFVDRGHGHPDLVEPAADDGGRIPMSVVPDIPVPSAVQPPCSVMLTIQLTPNWSTHPELVAPHLLLQRDAHRAPAGQLGPAARSSAASSPPG